MPRIGFVDYDELSPESQELDSRTLGQLVGMANLVVALVVLTDTKKESLLGIQQIRQNLATAEAADRPSHEFRRGQRDVLNLVEAHLRKL